MSDTRTQWVRMPDGQTQEIIVRSIRAAALKKAKERKATAKARKKPTPAHRDGLGPS